MDIRADQTPSLASWSNFAAQHRRIRSPLRPAPEDVIGFRQALAGRDGRVLLLGVTPELADIGEDLTAVDSSARMIEVVWPGDGDGRRAQLADWLDLPFEAGSFDAIIGDGCLNAVAEAYPALLLEISRILAPAGVAALRTFCAPERPEALSDIRHDVFDGWRGNFDALKWRIAMSLAADDSNYAVPVREILNTFDALFPNRARLGEVTGWGDAEFATVDYYKEVSYSLAFPPVSHFLSLARRSFAQMEVRASAGYPLADQCPMLVLERPCEAG